MKIDVDISNETEFKEIELEVVKMFTRDILNANLEKKDKDVYVSILFTNNEKIKELNSKYRGKDSSTDIISFAYNDHKEIKEEVEILGDIVVSIEKVKEQAKEYGHSFEREFYYILIHGILHLLGYDHIENRDKKIMREKEEEILSAFGYGREK